MGHIIIAWNILKSWRGRSRSYRIKHCKESRSEPLLAETHFLNKCSWTEGGRASVKQETCAYISIRYQYIHTCDTCVCKHLLKRRSNPWKADPWLVDLANVPWEDVVCTVWGCNTLSLSPWPSRKRGMAAPNLAHDPNKKSEWVGSLLSEKDKRIIADPWCDRWEWWELSQGFSCGGPLHRKEPMTPMCMSSAVMNILGRRDGGAWWSCVRLPERC